jgi:hypothetical protein
MEHVKFFFHNGQQWEEMTGKAHMAVSAAYRLWEESKQLNVECKINGHKYVIDWRAKVGGHY